MDDKAVDRATGIVARTFGNTISPVVTALMTAAAVATGDPALGGWAIPAGAFAGVLAEEVATTARRAWAAEGVQQFAEAVEAETGDPVEETLVGLSGDRRSRRLLGQAVGAAADAVDKWKIRILARAFVTGARDGARVDEMRMLIEVLAEMDTVDARVLGMLHDGCNTPEAASGRDPGLAPVVDIVLYRLQTADLADPGLDDFEPGFDGPFWELTSLGAAVASLLANLDTDAPDSEAPQ